MARRRWQGWDEDRFAQHPERSFDLADRSEVVSVRTSEVRADDPCDEVRFDDARISGSGLVGTTLTDLRISDSMLVSAYLAGVRWESCLWQRVEFRDCRLTGADLGRARLYQVRLIRCILDSVHLADAELVDVTMEGCSLADTFLGRSTLRRVSMDDCDLRGLDLERCEIEGLDLRGSQVAEIARLDSLRGATLDPTQVTDLAARMADRLGATVTAYRDSVP